ncbi:MAG: TonB family protein [Polyangiaceae bacterium]|nr:TonB family protein [Polyangiaceae bacterium]
MSKCRVWDGLGWALLAVAGMLFDGSLAIAALPLGSSAQSREEITKPLALSPLTAMYPEGASGDATVVLELTVDLDGDATSIVVIQGDSPFAEEAQIAASAWRFEPAKRGEKPVPARIRVGVEFRQPSEPSFDERPVGQPTVRVPSQPQKSPSAAHGLAVTVQGDRLRSTATVLSAREIRLTPGAFGDPLRSVESLPGVTPLRMGLPYFYLRGAPPSNTGYLVDGIRVPQLYHLMFGPSVLHPGVLESVNVYPSVYPVEYGGFAGGVIAAETKSQPANAREVDVRVVDAGALVSQESTSTNWSVLGAGRYSYTGAILSLVQRQTELGYWDYQTKAIYQLTPKSRVSLFAFGGADVLKNAPDSASQHAPKRTVLDSAFHRVALTYERELKAARLSARAYVGLDRSINGQFGTTERVGETQQDWKLKDSLFGGSVRLDQTWSPSADFRVAVEGQADSYHIVVPLGEDTRLQDRVDLRLTSWTDVKLRASPNITVQPGLRTDLYVSGVRHPVAPDPRAMAWFDVGRGWSLFNGVALTNQPPGFLVVLPGVPTTGLNGPLQRSIQSVAGIEGHPVEKLTAKFSLYQSASFNLTDPFAIAARDNQGSGTGSAAAGPPPEPTTTSSRVAERSFGHAAGIEGKIERQFHHGYGGFVSYTLSRSTRTYATGRELAAYDRTHIFTISGAGDLGRQWLGGARGTAFSGVPAQSVGKNPAKRAHPSYHVDLRLEKRWPLAGGASWSLIFEVYNATFSKDVVSYTCADGACELDEEGPIVIPSVGLQGVW